MFSKNVLRLVCAGMIAVSAAAPMVSSTQAAEFIASKSLKSPITQSAGARTDLYCPWGYHEKGEWYRPSHHSWGYKHVTLNKWQSNNCEKNKKRRHRHGHHGHHSN